MFTCYLLGASLCGVAPSAAVPQAPPDRTVAEAFVLVPGVRGGASRIGYEAWIRVDTYTVSIQRDPATGSTLRTLQVAGALDRSFPLMNVACARGEALGEARLELAPLGEVREPLVQVSFTAARCTSVELLHESGRALRQAYSFAFADVEWHCGAGAPRRVAEQDFEATRDLLVDAFVRFEGIAGASSTRGRADDSELFRSNAFISNDGAALPVFEPVATAGFLDRSFAPITRAVLDSREIATAEIRYVAAEAPERPILSIVFEGVVFDSAQASSLDGVPVQDHVFRYRRIRWTYTLLDASGVPAGQVTTGWDTATNTQSL